MDAAPRFALVAGEASGDLLAGLLLGGLRQRWPGLRSAGIGGPRMVAQGFDPWWPHDKLAVSGYVEVLRHYRELVGIRRQLRDRLIADPPDVFIGVDAPDFNLDLELQLRERGIRSAHFVCPSIWAWRPERIEKIRRACGHVLCIFPFEPELLHRHGVPATYVGHPLANVIPAEPDQAAARATLGLPRDGEVIAILPGSRASEVQRLAGIFFEAAVLLRRQRPGVRFAVPAIPRLRQRIEAAAGYAGLDPDVLTIVDGHSHDVLAACDLALVASGTATLEAALYQRPMVISYRVNAITHALMRRKQLQPWVGLPNILCREFVVPELLQHDATPQALARALLDWLEAPGRMAAVRTRFRALHGELRRDTATLATHAIEEVIQG